MERFRKEILNIIKTSERLGLVNVNNFGTQMKIINVLPNDRVEVQFQDQYKCEKEIPYNAFKKGNVKNPYDKSVFGYGYIGEGKHLTRLNSTKKNPYYNIWISMIERCCCEDKRDKHPAYEWCSICDEWLCYQTFADWCNKNYYDIKTERVHIDKDILVKDNKIYSPTTCLFVPQRINMIFMTKSRVRDKDLPNAIYRCASGYQSYYNGKSLGIFQTVKGAVSEHDKHKRIHIKNVAEEYRDRMPSYIYEALLKW